MIKCDNGNIAIMGSVIDILTEMTGIIHEVREIMINNAGIPQEVVDKDLKRAFELAFLSEKEIHAKRVKKEKDVNEAIKEIVDANDGVKEFLKHLLED